jgi:hypothetical protein
MNKKSYLKIKVYNLQKGGASLAVSDVNMPQLSQVRSNSIKPLENELSDDWLNRINNIFKRNDTYLFFF